MLDFLTDKLFWDVAGSLSQLALGAVVIFLIVLNRH